MSPQKQNDIKENKSSSETTPVWDVATRLFHWSLVILIIMGFVTNKFSDKIGFHWHKINGYTILALILFRVLWGLFGSSTSRFRNFVRPASIPTYLMGILSGKPLHYLGHNPAGAMMIIALLMVVTAQALTGLFSVDDITMMLFAGPFATKISENSVQLITSYHRIGFYIILFFVLIHIVVNFTYSIIMREGMILAMFTGRKKKQHYHDEAQASLTRQSLALASFVAAIIIVFGVVYFWGDAPFT